jgi:two-component system response regulator AtoC
MKDLFSVLERVSSSDTNILITGESGTGKEVVAKSIHQRSSRSRYPFQIIDCTAIPEGLFESVLFGHAKGAFTGAIRDQRGLLSECHQGTAFFDEIGELPLVLQAKLLRTVQEQTFTPVGETALRSFDTRFVCATNRDLAMEVRLGKFRRDLFYRLAVVHIELPPLRDRGADVMLLAHYFLRQLQPSGMHVSEFSDEVEACFLKYAWPGNVRELRNVVERALAFARSSRILISDLPTSVRQSGADDESGFGTPKSAGRQSSLKDAERRHLISLLKANGGNVSKAAIEAGVSRQGMHKMLVRYGINASDFRS